MYSYPGGGILTEARDGAMEKKKKGGHTVVIDCKALFLGGRNKRWVPPCPGSHVP